jgi:hypothetical protein
MWLAGKIKCFDITSFSNEWTSTKLLHTCILIVKESIFVHFIERQSPTTQCSFVDIHVTGNRDSETAGKPESRSLLLNFSDKGFRLVDCDTVSGISRRRTTCSQVRTREFPSEMFNKTTK